MTILPVLRITALALATTMLLVTACAEDEDPCHHSPCEPAPLELDLVTTDGQPVDTFQGEVRFEGGIVSFVCPAEPADGAAFACREDGVWLFIPIVEHVELTLASEVGSFAGAVRPQYESRTYSPAPEVGQWSKKTVWRAAETLVLE